MTLDFTASLYLGFRHETRSLRPWLQLTTGAPAALTRPPNSEMVERQLARLQGCEAASLAPSTLHLFWDWFGLLPERRIAVYLDAGTYPIARWGVERAAARHVPVRRFPHQNAAALQRLLQKEAGNRRPVVVSDGLCTVCGCAAPIADYLEVTRWAGGQLVIDDTQALGILGYSPGPGQPYGQGGGGSLRYCGLEGLDVLLISSLAKGFGVPMAALSGSRELIRKFESRSETRVHCSPPAAAAIHAAKHALVLNDERGEAARTALAQRVQQFRRGLAEAGLTAYGGWFPVQTLKLPPDANVRQFYGELGRRGVRTVLRSGHDGQPQISFILTARHRPEEIAAAVQAVATIVNAEAQLELEGG